MAEKQAWTRPWIKNFVANVAGVETVNIEWRYLREKMRASGIRIDRAIFVMKVMHEACRKAIGLEA